MYLLARNFILEWSYILETFSTRGRKKFYLIHNKPQNPTIQTSFYFLNIQVSQNFLGFIKSLHMWSWSHAGLEVSDLLTVLNDPCRLCILLPHGNSDIIFN